MIATVSRFKTNYLPKTLEWQVTLNIHWDQLSCSFLRQDGGFTNYQFSANAEAVCLKINNAMLSGMSRSIKQVMIQQLCCL